MAILAEFMILAFAGTRLDWASTLCVLRPVLVLWLALWVLLTILPIDRVDWRVVSVPVTVIRSRQAIWS